jgi:hypothetical protein
VTPLRVLAALGVSLAIAGAVVAALPQRDRPAPPAAEAAEPPPHQARPVRAPRREPPPLGGAGAPRLDVPAGILARAATSRALERGPSCSSAPSEAAPRCPPEQRESIEIDWRVPRDDAEAP